MLLGYLLLSVIPVFSFCYYVLPKLIPWSDKYRDLFAYQDWRAETEARGLTFGEAVEELRLREHLAKVRRIASREVLKRPDKGGDIMQATIAEEIRSIGSLDKSRAKVFAKASKTWSSYDLLYPDAERAWLTASHVPMLKPTPEEREDMMAAMNIR